ncbi:hypothetical protein C0J52_06222, partial [Blattella germanica]
LKQSDLTTVVVGNPVVLVIIDRLLFVLNIDIFAILHKSKNIQLRKQASDTLLIVNIIQQNIDFSQLLESYAPTQDILNYLRHKIADYVSLEENDQSKNSKIEIISDNTTIIKEEIKCEDPRKFLEEISELAVFVYILVYHLLSTYYR